MGLLVFVAYFQTIFDIAKSWWFEPEMSHGMLVPFVVAYGLWLSKDRLLAQPASGRLLGMWLLCISLIVHVLGTAIQSRLFNSFALVGTVLGLLLMTLGPAWLTIVKGPLALMFFAIPPPVLVYESITNPLVGFAARAGELGLEALGYTVLRQGNIIQLPGFTLSVAEACSGLGSLYSLLFLSSICVVFVLSDWFAFWSLSFVAILAAILTNACRIVLTGVLGTWNRSWTQGSVHESVGFFTFLLGAALTVGFCTAIHKLRLRNTK